MGSEMCIRDRFDNNEKETGMTIHYVNEKYDEGHIIFQTSVALAATDTPDIIASKVLELEHRHYAQVIEEVILGRKKRLYRV